LIIQRYLLREIVVAFGAVLGVLVLIYVSNRFVRYLAEAAAGTISGEAVLELLSLKLISSLSVFVPLAIFLSVLLALGRLYRDSEIIAMSAGGFGANRIALTVLLLSVVFALLSSGLSLYVSPEFRARMEERREQAREESVISAIFPGRFREFGYRDQVIYVEDVDRESERMHNVFVQVRRSEKNSLDLVVARSAYLQVDPRHKERYVVLEDGYRYEGAPGDLDFIVTKFQHYAVHAQTGTGVARHRRLEAIPSLELMRSDDPAQLAELQWRVSMPLSVVILGVLAVPLARTSPKQGRYAKLFTSILVYFVYNNVLGIAQKLVERGDVPVWIGVWPVHLLFAVTAAGLLFAQTSVRWHRIRAAAKQLRYRR
jgi:lipopolysaccharide export system permease protein